MRRLSLGARLTTIVIVTMIAVWLVALIMAYRARFDDGAITLPSSAGIAAIAELAEATQKSDRPRLIAATTSPTVAVAILPARAISPGMTDRLESAPTLDDLGPRLDGRPWGLATLPGEALFRRSLAGGGYRAGVRIEIALRTGEILEIVARSPLGITRLGLPVGLAAGLFGTLIGLAALTMLNRETRPIARLAAAVDGMTLDGEPIRLPHSRWSAPEIEALSAAFERLQGRLSQLVRSRMAMLGGISHDVRTFATRLRLRVEAIADDAERERAIADIADMIHLLDDALLASRSGASELSEELLDFAEIVAGEVGDRIAAGAAVTLATPPGMAAGFSVIGDRLALRRVVSNLVDNALKYGHAADVDLERAGADIRLVVDDHGSGIAAGDRDALLEPFVRLEASRNRSTGGAGLGLAIVRSLIEAHGGRIEIGDAPGGGARFIVTLPAFDVV